MTQVWVAARNHEYGGPGKASAWELLGIYTTEASAAARCRVRETDFIGPVTLDVDLCEAIVEWPGVYHPLAYPSHEAEVAARVASGEVTGA
jgi:hypothetical protein